MKTLFEQAGGKYTMQGDYRLPNLELPPEKEQSIGVWGQRRLRYLKQHHKVLYYNLPTSGKLRSHLADTDEQAQQFFLRVSGMSLTKTVFGSQNGLLAKPAQKIKLIILRS